jgi:hypothetical protein
MYEDHLKSCSYCQGKDKEGKPTIRVKSASSADKRRKLTELGYMIKGIQTQTKTKGTSFVENNTRRQGPIEKEFKLRELAKMIRG